MTTTSVYSGMNLDRPTSKVLQQPGGNSSISFGGGYEQEAPKPRQQQQPKTDVLAQQPQQDLTPVKSAKPQDSAGETQAHLFGAGDPEPSAKPASGKRRYDQNKSNFNILSGEPTAASGQAGGARGRKQADRVDPANMPAAGGRLENRQVTRTQPPGGKSSISFGGN